MGHNLGRRFVTAAVEYRAVVLLPFVFLCEDSIVDLGCIDVQDRMYGKRLA
jgi:hypothetical protein